MGIQSLRERWPWPSQKPAAEPDPSGWFHGGCRAVLSRHLENRPCVILELGSWLGMSAAWFCLNAPWATVVCVDHWKGSAEHQVPPFSDRLPHLYETFLVNLWPYRERVVPVRMDTLRGMWDVQAHDVTPDLIYIDASHEREDVRRDVMYADMLWPNAPIVGDDWTWSSVRAGVNDALGGKLSRQLVEHNVCYELLP